MYKCGVKPLTSLTHAKGIDIRSKPANALRLLLRRKIYPDVWCTRSLCVISRGFKKPTCSSELRQKFSIAGYYLKYYITSVEQAILRKCTMFI